MVGPIYFGFMASTAASTGVFHPYALGMASGVGTGILMSSAVAALSEVMPAYADQIAAMERISCGTTGFVDAGANTRRFLPGAMTGPDCGAV